MEITFDLICETGLVRNVNQDAVFTKTGNDWGMFIVADGMGGHSEGERASREIVEAYAEWLEEEEPGFENYDLMELIEKIKEIISGANEKIFLQTPPGQICGSTVVILMIIKNLYILISVGDSRCYELQKKFFRSSLHQLTKDEVWGTALGKNGSGMEGKLTNAVGIRRQLQMNIFTAALPENQVFCLCTDGVYKYCSEECLRDAMVRAGKNRLEEAMRRIKETVCKNGAKDNFSAVLVCIR